jgi:hypothetical protein
MNMTTSFRRVVRRCGLAVALAATVLPAARSDAWAYQTYKNTLSPLPNAPAYAVNPEGFTRNIYWVRFTDCSSGNWTRRIHIIVANGAMPYFYQGTGCGGAGPNYWAVALAGSGCTKATPGTYDANCRMGV